jgi:NhaA family Na+:H+ antiporter
MKSKPIKQEPIDRWLIDPLNNFIHKSTSGGIVLFGAAILALIVANSPWSGDYHAFWHTHFSIGFGDHVLDKTLHHWINDGLMAVFFFVVGLELKREIRMGELSKPKDAILPVAAALGGMAVPAIVYLVINPSGEASNGWGIPMATDIAFALGVLYLLGDKVPKSLKIFLTVLAIADDIGAVLVIALFYTSHIDVESLIVGGVFMALMMGANLIGVRNTFFYAVLGIGGLWLAFLMSGVHATIAAVLAAFTIPADVKVGVNSYLQKVDILMKKFVHAAANSKDKLKDQMYAVAKIRDVSKMAVSPLHRLEYRMHPLVAFVIMPIFAFSNAGVTIAGNALESLLEPVAIGVFLGLLLGKVVGILGVVWVLTKSKIVVLPSEMNMQMVFGASLLAAIGFTMSLFVTDLAFDNPQLEVQAKLGILLVSIIASFAGFFVIRSAVKHFYTQQ